MILDLIRTVFKMRYLKQMHRLSAMWVKDEKTKKTNIEVLHNDELLEKFEG